jgi:peptidoglycan/LPS O-acetylase OafA/YrhL
MSASRVSKQYLPLTSLRFFAALGILIHHYGESLDQLIPKALHPFIHTGGWGITLFFVLSGFILSFAYEDKIVADKLDLREFYVNRFARVYPLYAFALIISLPQVLLYVKANPGVFGSGYLAAFIVSKFTLLSTWSPEFCIRPPLLLASWTLCA